MRSQGGLAPLSGHQPANVPLGLPGVQPATTVVPSVPPLTMALCLTGIWVCFLNTGL